MTKIHTSCRKILLKPENRKPFRSRWRENVRYPNLCLPDKKFTIEPCAVKCYSMFWMIFRIQEIIPEHIFYQKKNIKPGKPLVSVSRRNETVACCFTKRGVKSGSHFAPPDKGGKSPVRQRRIACRSVLLAPGRSACHSENILSVRAGK